MSYGYALNEGLAQMQAAMGQASAANANRQATARDWMGHPLSAPTVSGDRQPAHESHAGYVNDGVVFDIGQSPAAPPPLLPEAQTNTRLPDPPPPAPPVTVSSTRPRGFVGFVFNQHQTTRPSVPATVTYVSVDVGGGRSGVLGWLRRLFGGGAR